jgi:hypothetical protein
MYCFLFFKPEVKAVFLDFLAILKTKSDNQSPAFHYLTKFALHLSVVLTNQTQL